MTSGFCMRAHNCTHMNICICYLWHENYRYRDHSYRCTLRIYPWSYSPKWCPIYVLELNHYLQKFPLPLLFWNEFLIESILCHVKYLAQWLLFTHLCTHSQLSDLFTLYRLSICGPTWYHCTLISAWPGSPFCVPCPGSERTDLESHVRIQC